MRQVSRLFTHYLIDLRERELPDGRQHNTMAIVMHREGMEVRIQVSSFSFEELP